MQKNLLRCLSSYKFAIIKSEIKLWYDQERFDLSDPDVITLLIHVKSVFNKELLKLRCSLFFIITINSLGD
ncbi:MAG: hypothetical protein ACI82Q_001729 [Nonlabens sp.]|jgi:hypothetical protein